MFSHRPDDFIYSIFIDKVRERTRKYCAWPIVKGLSSYACIICIHHSVNKPYSEPLSYEIQLYVYDFFKQSESWILKFFEFWVMPANSIIYQSFHIFLSSIILCKLKSSYSDMWAHNSREYCSIFYSFAIDFVSGLYDCETSRSIYSQSMHCFTH